MKVSQSKNGISVTAYRGDAMTLLAFDVASGKRNGLTGFSIRVTPPGHSPYYLFNRLKYPDNITYEAPGTPNRTSTEFSPIQLFSWIHVPSTYHHVGDNIFGVYNYDVTPRYLAGSKLQQLDPSLTVSVSIQVTPFQIKGLHVGFTRSFIASQATADHFGNIITLRPPEGNAEFGKLLFNTKLKSGDVQQMVNGVTTAVPYSYDDMFSYLGWQARQRITDFLDEALKDPGISLDVFAFDLDEPHICGQLLTLAGEGRIRVLLDNSSTHIGMLSKKGAGKNIPQYEDQFEQQFRVAAKGNAAINRGCFFSLAHSKVFIQKKNGAAIKVLTGSTNFSLNGLYVNANNVLVFDSPAIAGLYERIFEASFPDSKAFKTNRPLASTSFSFNSPGAENNVDDSNVPPMVIRFSPHPENFATDELNDLANEVNKANSILFAIMNDRSGSPLLKAIMNEVRSNQTYTLGITDVSKEVLLYSPNSKTGIHATGKGLENVLPPPFVPEPGIQGISIHHKFVVLNFNSDNGIVICGSSNLALGPEQQNGDNLLVISDPDVVTAFGIEAIRLVDHFQFRDKSNKANKVTDLELHTDSSWADPYFADGNMLCKQRVLFMKEQ